MPASLDLIVQTYLNDTEFLEEGKRIAQSREANLPTLKRIVMQFIDETLDINAFREQIDRALSGKEAWSARGAFLMELNKFAKNHSISSVGSKNTEVETTLRQILTGLNTQTVGERIEILHAYLQQERLRFHKEERAKLSNVSPGNSALIISLLAHWLDWTGTAVIYYLSQLTGLKMLLDRELLPKVEGLRFKQDRVVITTNADHQAVIQALENLSEVAPQLKALTKTYWTERFMYWITKHIDEVDDEGTDRGFTPVPIVRVLEHRNVAPTPELRLQELIAELRRHILIDDKLVRRIYHALLAGHVILTGPPGTGKTVLAKLIPEILWKQDETDTTGKPTAYTTQLVTATDEWSVRTLIGGLTPSSVNGQVVYHVQYGHLTESIRKNWAGDVNNPLLWREQRISVYAPSLVEKGTMQEFRGNWLIIDEFNRAPIDLALGGALTSLSNGSGEALHVPTDSGFSDLPLPQDFRIIGTLNSFDRNYLNQISEALKRRFSFIEILPPTRAQSKDEQKIVLQKAFDSIIHLGTIVSIINPDNSSEYYYKPDVLDPFDSLIYETNGTWVDTDVKAVFEIGWRIFEVIRMYRQLGTAQAIALVRQMFIAGFLQVFTSKDGDIWRASWMEALDNALCDTVIDQLQVLLPDEIEVLYGYVKYGAGDTFIDMYNTQLAQLAPRRRRAQLEALGSVVNEDGAALLDDEQIEKLALQTDAKLSRDVLLKIFRLDEQQKFVLPQFARRLRLLKAERGL